MNMKRIVIIVMLWQSWIMMGMAQVSFGNATMFNDGWLFMLGADSAAVNDDFNDTSWRHLTLPHDWSIEGIPSPTLASCTGYLPAGIGCYRKHFNIADTTLRHYIYFEGVYNRSEVYLNGHLLGKRPNGYISFMYDMTPYLRKGTNTLAVWVDHSRHADSRWYTGSGIYRDVYLITSGNIHFAQWGVAWHAASITDRQAVVNVDMEVENHDATARKTQIVASLYDAQGRKVASKSMALNAHSGTTKGTIALKVSKPERWNLDAPYLYTLKTQLMIDGKTIDHAESSVGLRTLQFDANRGFALNGKWMKVKGVCLHHDAGVLGAVVPADVWERRIRQLKTMGANAIRMSHNPQAPVVYDLCDRLGMLVMDEASDEWEYPKRKWIEGWNVGTPAFQGSYDFFEEWIERDVTDMVRRDRNHPCVFLWSIGNEVDYPNDPYSHPILDGTTINQPMFGGYKPDAPDAMRIGQIAQRLVKCVKDIDTSRPTTGALAGVVMSNQTAYPEAVDVVGYNYTENRYDEDHNTYPQRIIYGSETGSGIEAWQAVTSRDYIFGQFIWTGTDYLGEAGRWPSRGLYTGLLDFGSFAKPRGQMRASLWRDDPVCYIGTYPIKKHGNHDGNQQRWLSPDAWDIWNYRQAQIIRVVCYTNAPQARLMLNGTMVGEMKQRPADTGIIHWDIPYQPGTLKAEACNAEGRVVANYSITSSGRPFSLRATADKHIVKAGDKRVVHVTVEVLDEQGTIVKLADNDITCRVKGQGHLLGLENSNNADMSMAHQDHRRAYHGRLLAYIETTGKQGDITIEMTSPLLNDAEITIRVE